MNYLSQLEAFFSGQLKTFKMLATLIRLEAKLARMTLFPLLINVCMIFVILITSWASMMVLLGYAVFCITQMYWISIVSVCITNMLALLGLLKYLAFNLNAMSFAKTRHYLLKTQSQGKE
ncbi:MAG: hypothetical protein CK426_04265 [Legionella sp.]|nr:MAG: hypothetical protein CK423_03515 [Legionella sp.]PJD98901.1 MAG: hypothetical protein CK426_04265 [Legionella sp.]